MFSYLLNINESGLLRIPPECYRTRIISEVIISPTAQGWSFLDTVPFLFVNNNENWSFERKVLTLNHGERIRGFETKESLGAYHRF